MAAHWFTFAGTDSRNMHIRVPDRIPVIRPEERVEHVTIPGRSGELTQVEGDDIYNSYIQTVRISVLGREYIRPAESWLRGEGMVTFSCQPDLQQRARIINAVTFEQHSRNLDIWHGDLQFYCDPCKRMITEGDSLITESGTPITNPGSMIAFPLIVMHGSGRVTLRMGGNSMVIPELTDGWILDAENKWILGSNGKPMVGVWSGEFPVLPVGESLIQWTGGITSLVITPRWRFL